MPPGYSATSIEGEEQTLAPEHAFERALDCGSRAEGEIGGLMEDDIIDDASYQYDGDLDEERNPEFTSSELSLCPICSTLFDEEDDVCIKHSHDKAQPP